MSNKRTAISRYAIIINKLRRRPASYKEILNSLELESEIHSDDYTISKRTFQRDIEDIYSIYGIEIKFDFRANAYHIVEEYESASDTNYRLLEAFDTFNALKVTRRLPQYIHFESRRVRGTENMSALLHAIQNKLRIQFTYHKFWNNQTEERQVEPLALKESINRWYLVAIDTNKKAVRTFGLDRISDIDFSKGTFRSPNDFSVNKMFEHCFGAISGVNQEPESVILEFAKPQALYIKSLPLHTSQKIIIETETQIRFALKLLVTEDFVQELLSHANRVKVIEPQHLVNKIKNHCKEMLGNYE